MPNSNNKIYMVFASKFVGTLAVLLMEKMDHLNDIKSAHLAVAEENRKNAYYRR